MEYNKISTINDHNIMSSLSPISSPVILSPCAACKILRRRCVDKCVLAPYFPPTEPLKFAIAHRVFGASNIIKLLQELSEDQRADAVNSMVYEANARLRDPIYGCAGAISQLLKKINDLQAELAKAQAEKLTAQCHNFNLMAELIKRQNNGPFVVAPEISSHGDRSSTDNNFYSDEGDFDGAVSWDFGASMDMNMMEIIGTI